MKSEKDLESKEEEAEGALLELQTKLSEAVSRLQRIRKIKRKVKERSDEMFARGMQELDEEDGILPALSLHEQWVTNDLNALGVSADADFSLFGLDVAGESVGTGVTSSSNS